MSGRPEAYPFKTLDQAKAVREAIWRVSNEWRYKNLDAVKALMPQVATDAGHQTDDWVISVETQRRDWETPEAAAERLALWVTLHAERWGKVPTEMTIQRTTETTIYKPETENEEQQARRARALADQQTAAEPWTPRDRNSW